MLLESDAVPMTLRPYSAEPTLTVCSVRRMRRVIWRAWMLLRLQCARDLVACALLESAIRERLRLEDERRQRLGPVARYRLSPLTAARLVVLQRIASPPFSATVTWLEAAELGPDVVLSYGLAQRLREEGLFDPTFPIDELLAIEYTRDVIVRSAA